MAFSGTDGSILHSFFAYAPNFGGGVRVAAGDVLDAGARIGLMKFGSRMDVFVPVEAAVLVKKGEIVRAGETVIARLRA